MFVRKSWSRIRSVMLAALLAGGLVFAVGCQDKGGQGALIGGGIGAGAGAIIGHQSDHAAEGAAIGGAVGAGTGYVVGESQEDDEY